MKLTKESLANALGLVTVISWVVCSAFVAFLPDLSLTISSWWMHGLDITALGNWNLTFGNFLWGGVSLSISGWLFGYLLGWGLEYFNKR